MKKKYDLDEEERKQIRNEFQKWGKWMLATILLIVGLVVYDANTANAQDGFVPPMTADNMEMVEVCKWKGRLANFMSIIYIQEGDAMNTDREDISFVMGRPATVFEQSVIDDALKKVNEILDDGINDPNTITQLIFTECMQGAKESI